MPLKFTTCEHTRALVDADSRRGSLLPAERVAPDVSCRLATRLATPALTTTFVLPNPSARTSSNSLAAFAGEMRMQPCDAGDPRRRIALLPWIACPAGVKKIECGIGASSHSFE